MTWRNTKVEDQRLYLVERYLNKLVTMKDLCEELGISRKTGYKWIHRYEKFQSVSDLSKAPLDPYRKFTEEDLRIALEMKQNYPKLGPKKIHAKLTKIFPEKEWPSPTRLYEVFKDHHLVCSRRLRRRVPRTHPLAEVNQSNDVWCADFKGWFLTDDKTKIEPLTITDGYSRYLIRCQHLDKKDFENVWNVYTEAFHQYGLPYRIRTDNGPPFATTGVGRLSRLAVNLIKVGVTPEWIKPGHPEENGRHERFHRTLKDAIANPSSINLVEQLKSIKIFSEEYNFDRPHEALNQQTPGSYYKPSERQWDGKLHPPEYSNDTILRKVCVNGCIYWKKMHCYLGQLLSGEYVGLKQVDDGIYQVFYGPVLLGNVVENVGFQEPKLEIRR